MKFISRYKFIDSIRKQASVVSAKSIPAASLVENRPFLMNSLGKLRHHLALYTIITNQSEHQKYHSKIIKKRANLIIIKFD